MLTANACKSTQALITSLYIQALPLGYYIKLSSIIFVPFEFREVHARDQGVPQNVLQNVAGVETEAAQGKVFMRGRQE
jgi:hypothetical protein